MVFEVFHKNVSMKGYDSIQLDVKCGVPQGSTLGPLLFLIYINDFRYCFNKSTASHFAEDTCIMYSNKKIKSLETILNTELKTAATWLKWVKWVHAPPMKKCSLLDLHQLTDLNNNDPWFCPSCIASNLPFNDSNFFLFQYDILDKASDDLKLYPGESFTQFID